MQRTKSKHSIITLEPLWWRCENGSEFRSGQNKPTRCPICGSANIEIIADVAPEFSRKRKGRT